MMYKSQFQKINPYDWFCDPGSQLILTHPSFYRKYSDVAPFVIVNIFISNLFNYIFFPQ